MSVAHVVKCIGIFFKEMCLYDYGHSCYQDVFINQVEIVVKKTTLIKVKVEDQWLTEKEMKTDFGWSQNLAK